MNIDKDKNKKICFRERDIIFVEFLAEYGSISNENVKVFYNSKYYYKNRLASLAKGGMIDRLYTYVLPMPFTDFARIDWINYMANSRDYKDVLIKVVCSENCIEIVREFVDEKVEVVCILE